MKIHCILIGLFLLSITKAQTVDVNFLAEGNKNNVKLFWLPASWPEKAEGFNIKRRENKNLPWVQLNSSVILPGNLVSKDLSNVEKNKQALSDLVNKRNQYIKGVTSPLVLKIDEFPSEVCYQKGKDSGFFVGLSMLISQDYDIAKMFGFALEDKNIPLATKYEYGLFIKQINGEEKLIRTIEWIYGSSPEVNFIININQKPSINRKSVEVQWSFNYLDYKNHPTISGFNMYRKEKGKTFEKLNKNRIWVSSNDSLAKIIYNDNKLKDSLEYIYALAPITIFNSEAKYVEINYDPQNVPSENIAIKLRKDTLSDNIRFFWDYNKNNEQFIKGFTLLRSVDVLSKFEVIGNVLPSERSFIDKTIPNSKYFTYNYKVEAVLNNFPKIESNTISFFTPPKPPVPKNFKATLSNENNKSAVLLQWDQFNADTITKEFKIYETDRNPKGTNPLLYGSSLGPTKENSVKYTLVSEGNKYGFAVSTVYNILNINIESEKSDIIFVTIPTSDINRLQFESVTLTEKKEVIFSWVYNSDNYPDMKGFRIYNNNQIMFDENIIGKDLRTLTTSILSKGQYAFQITAITNNGIESEKMPIWKKSIE